MWQVTKLSLRRTVERREVRSRKFPRGNRETLERKSGHQRRSRDDFFWRCQTEALGEKLQHTGCRPSPLEEIVETHGTMSLGETVAVGPEDKWHMGVRQLGEAELSTKPHLPWRGQQEVIGPHHLLDTLGGIIDDNSQIIGENTVISNQNQVVHDRFHFAADRVDKSHDGRVGPNPQRRTSTSIP